MNCHNCNKGFNQPLANETICLCRQNKKGFLKVTDKTCKQFKERNKK